MKPSEIYTEFLKPYATLGADGSSTIYLVIPLIFKILDEMDSRLKALETNLADSK